jgi:branched-chain amino acid transport system ATP-binding protein
MLRLDAISAGYGATTALRSVTLTMPPSSVFAVLGANGAGKTTLLRVASGLIRTTSGRVTVDDVDLTHKGPEEYARHGISHIPEGRGIFPSMTVRENLRLFCPQGSEEIVLGRITETFPILGSRIAQLAGTLSGGEQQMLALARCFATEPRFVLVDEVSLGLAPKVVDEIFEFLERIVAGGASLLLVEQYVMRALRLADYVLMLDRGRVVFAGEPGELDQDEVFAHYVGDRKQMEPLMSGGAERDTK